MMNLHQISFGTVTMRADFRLGEWIVHPQRDCIERGRETVHVKPKSMAVLEELARARGEAVTRHRIFDVVWPGGAVTDDVLTQCIVELRKAFGDSARQPRYIETIPKVGFRLIPAVKSLERAEGAEEESPVITPGAPFRPATRVLFVIASTLLLGLVFFWYLGGSRNLPDAAVMAGEKSLAVLPFVDISEQQDQGWYAYGLTEELINRLVRLEGLQVTGQISSFHFENSEEPPERIAGALGVRYLLEGSVRTDDDRVRIGARLIDTEKGVHAWSNQFERPREDIFDVQEEIAESVAAALSIELGVGELGTLAGGTDSVEAYELVMLSKRFQWENTPDSIIKAIDLVKRAIEIDPDYARAWLRLSGLYLNARSIFFTSDETDWIFLSRQALDQARSLEPNLAGVKHLTTTIQYNSWDWAGVERTMNGGEGLELSSDFDLLFGWAAFLKITGRIEESVRLLERMRDMNPYSNGTARVLSWAYVIQGRTEEGITEAERAFELDGFPQWAVENGLLISLALDDIDLLIRWLARAEQYLPGEQPLIEAMSETLDDPEAALAWLRVTFQRTSDHDYLLAHWAAWLGDQELALDAMARQPVPSTLWGVGMRDIRRHPRFNDLVRQVGFEDYFRAYGWNDFCHPVGTADFRCDE